MLGYSKYLSSLLIDCCLMRVIQTSSFISLLLLGALSCHLLVLLSFLLCQAETSAFPCHITFPGRFFRGSGVEVTDGHSSLQYAPNHLSKPVKVKSFNSIQLRDDKNFTAIFMYYYICSQGAEASLETRGPSSKHAYICCPSAPLQKNA